MSLKYFHHHYKNSQQEKQNSHSSSISRANLVHMYFIPMSNDKDVLRKCPLTSTYFSGCKHQKYPHCEVQWICDVSNVAANFRANYAKTLIV